MKYLVTVLAVAALAAGAVIPRAGKRQEDHDVILEGEASEELEPVKHGEYIPGLGYVSYHSQFWGIISQLDNSELEAFITELHNKHDEDQIEQALNKEVEEISRKKEDYGVIIPGLGYISIYSPFYTVITNMDAEQLEAFIAELHSNQNKPEEHESSVQDSDEIEQNETEDASEDLKPEPYLVEESGVNEQPEERHNEVENEQNAVSEENIIPILDQTPEIDLENRHDDEEIIDQDVFPEDRNDDEENIEQVEENYIPEDRHDEEEILEQEEGQDTALEDRDDNEEALSKKGELETL